MTWLRREEVLLDRLARHLPAAVTSPRRGAVRFP